MLSLEIDTGINFNQHMRIRACSEVVPREDGHGKGVTQIGLDMIVPGPTIMQILGNTRVIDHVHFYPLQKQGAAQASQTSGACILGNQAGRTAPHGGHLIPFARLVRFTPPLFEPIYHRRMPRWSSDPAALTLTLFRTWEDHGTPSRGDLGTSPYKQTHNTRHLFTSQHIRQSYR